MASNNSVAITVWFKPDRGVPAESLCTSTSFNDSAQECALKVNNIICNSCSVQGFCPDTSDPTQVYGRSFDCTNTVLNVQGNTCEPELEGSFLVYALCHRQPLLRCQAPLPWRCQVPLLWRCRCPHWVLEPVVCQRWPSWSPLWVQQPGWLHLASNKFVPFLWLFMSVLFLLRLWLTSRLELGCACETK